MLVAIHSTMKSVGIALTEMMSIFAVNNSYFSTKVIVIGLAASTMTNYLTRTIFNTYSNGSCITVERAQKVTFKLSSSIIKRCSCPKVMQFLYLAIDVTLENIIASDNRTAFDIIMSMNPDMFNFVTSIEIVEEFSLV